MPPLINEFLDFMSSDTFSLIKVAGLGYFALLWLSIIIWVTKDALQRSNSILFQAFSILLNIAIPILGILLYLIIRPGKTRMERYYEELEKNMLESETDHQEDVCGKCLMHVEKDYLFCPNCGEGLKKECNKCKKIFPEHWNICPFCGHEQKEIAKKSVRKKTSDESESM